MNYKIRHADYQSGINQRHQSTYINIGWEKVKQIENGGVYRDDSQAESQNNKGAED